MQKDASTCTLQALSDWQWFGNVDHDLLSGYWQVDTAVHVGDKEKTAFNHSIKKGLLSSMLYFWPLQLGLSILCF